MLGWVRVVKIRLASAVCSITEGDALELARRLRELPRERASADTAAMLQRAAASGVMALPTYEQKLVLLLVVNGWLQEEGSLLGERIAELGLSLLDEIPERKAAPA